METKKCRSCGEYPFVYIESNEIMSICPSCDMMRPVNQIMVRKKVDAALKKEVDNIEKEIDKTAREFTGRFMERLINGYRKNGH